MTRAVVTVRWQPASAVLMSAVVQTFGAHRDPEREGARRSDEITLAHQGKPFLDEPPEFSGIM